MFQQPKDEQDWNKLVRFAKIVCDAASGIFEVTLNTDAEVEMLKAVVEEHSFILYESISLDDGTFIPSGSKLLLHQGKGDVQNTDSKTLVLIAHGFILVAR